MIESKVGQAEGLSAAPNCSIRLMVYIVAR